MATLDFHGPFHFNDINKNGQIKNDRNPNNSPAPDKPGIYIWGFMYYYNYDGLTEPVDFKKDDIRFNENKMKFIPYYVGEHKKSIINRICQHHKIQEGDRAKYLRLSNDYMKEFFKDNCFPIHTNTKKHKENIKCIVKSNSSTKITYCNYPEILQMIYPNLKIVCNGRNGTDCPITLQKIFNQELPDTLSDLIYLKNNFWFCYANLLNATTSEIKQHETYVYYALKGKTISNTGKCPVKSNGISINNCTSSDIFKESPSEIFNGY